MFRRIGENSESGGGVVSVSISFQALEDVSMGTFYSFAWDI